MKGDHLPPHDHVSRYCGGKHIAENGRPLATAFRHRPNEEFLSVNWLESLHQNDRESQIREVRQRLDLVLGATAKIAVLNVGETCEDVERAGFKIGILHEPKARDSSHSGFFGILQDELKISLLIAEKVLEVYPAREP